MKMRENITSEKHEDPSECLLSKMVRGKKQQPLAVETRVLVFYGRVR